MSIFKNPLSTEIYDDSEPLFVTRHDPLSGICLQGLAEYFIPNATNEKKMEFIEVIQKLITTKS